MQKAFNVYSDPGHGWAKVSLSLIKELGLQHDISCYSYMRGKFVYLEEDCDLSKFAKALRDRGIEPKWKENVGNKRSKIRGYRSYNRICVNWVSCEVD